MATEKTFTVITANGKKTFKSTANTVAELKADLHKHGISTENMAIQEGLTKTKFTSDGQYLPHDVPYKGGTTNNLVFRVTQAEKHIKSGAMSRAEAYAEVKRLGLQDAIKEKFGKNFTMCKTADLIAMVEAAGGKAPAQEAAPESSSHAESQKGDKDEGKKAGEKKDEGFKSCGDPVKDAITVLVSKIVDSGILTASEGKEVTDLIGTEIIEDEGYSQEEIDRMFKDM